MDFMQPRASSFEAVDPKILVGRWSVQPKLDGVRCLAVLPANRGDVVLLDDHGKPFLNFESVRLKLQEINSRRNPTNTLVLDGEMVAYVNEKADRAAIEHTMMRKDGKEAGRLRFMIFDGAYESEWKNPQLAYTKRYDFVSKFIAEQLEAIVGAVSRIGVVPQHVTIDPDRKRMLLNSRQFAEQGHLGAMFRRADQAVDPSRVDQLLTVKSFVEAEAEVLGLVMGMGGYEGRIGALKCRTLAGQEFNLETGFTDEQRRALWRTRNDLPKRLLFRYQGMENGVPIFPIFKGFP